jgi:hypothetical protein
MVRSHEADVYVPQTTWPVGPIERPDNGSSEADRPVPPSTWQEGPTGGPDNGSHEPDIPVPPSTWQTGPTDGPGQLCELWQNKFKGVEVEPATSQTRARSKAEESLCHRLCSIDFIKQILVGWAWADVDYTWATVDKGACCCFFPFCLFYFF